MDIPPLHPILVNFTAALVPTSLVCDVLARLLNKESLRSTAWWTLCFATIVTPLTAAAGWWWLYDMEGMDMPEMKIHQWLGSILAAVFLGLCVWRWRFHRSARQPTAAYLVAAAVLVIALVVQGHLGGVVSFGSTTAMEPTSSPHQHGHDVEWKEYIQLEERS